MGKTKLPFTGNGAGFVQSKQLLEAMLAATNETKGPCAAFLKKKGAEPDIRHILGAGSKARCYKVLWPTAPVGSEEGGTTVGQAELDKWLHTFFTLTVFDI